MTRKMLVIDDEPVLLSSCRRVFEAEDFYVITTTSPEEGLALVLDTYFDVILCDWMMPGLDGMEVITRLEQTSPGSAVVMISGYPSIGRATEAMKRGAMDYVAKPFTPDEIINTVTEAIERKEDEETKIIERFGRLTKTGQISLPSIDEKILQTLSAAIDERRRMGAQPSLESLSEPERLQEITFAVLDKYERDKNNLIAMLQAVHSYAGYLSYETIGLIARELQISEHDIFGTASFYAQFKFQKPGRHLVRVCTGTACFVSGGGVILEATKSRLNIVPGQTTEDGLFSLERVACLGCCALAPVITIDDEVYGQMSPAKLSRTIDKVYRAESKG
ncbi:MAG TPA: NAD(P)H-dependent oxidoreductase subunit E [Desulfatiglandales bacterium]|nr:NAD(P)H-dependent oxidoreductase subunit E [Desulfatiglandales bacterium]